VRFAFQTFSHNGYMKSGLDDANERGGRLSLRWRPVENDTLTIIGDFSKNNGREGAINVVAKQPGTNFFVPDNPRDDRFYATDTASERAEVPFRDQKNRGVTAINDYAFDFATWTTEIAYRKFDSESVSTNNYGQGPVVAGFPTSGHNYNPQHFESWSFESRLTSASTRPLSWVVGVYGFLDEDSGTMIGYGSLRTTTPSIQIANPYEKAKSAAVFGQVTYTPTGLDQLHFVVGARGNVDHKNAQGIFTQFGTAVPYAAGPSDFEKTWRAFTYKLGVSYDITDRNLIYANYSTGFKSGGFAYGPGIDPAAGPVYDPEKIKAWEIGSKNRFLDNRLQVNLEGFYYKYKDYQSNVTLFSLTGPPLPVLTVASAGAATYKGVTANVEFALSRNDTLRADASLIDAKYGDYAISAPAGYRGGFNKSGTHIPGVPQWAGSVSYSHTFELAAGRLNAEVFTSLRGPIDLAVEDDPVYGRVIVRDHTWSLWNASLRYEPNDGDWALTAYARNIGNDTRWIGAGYSTTTHLTTALFNDPRVVGFIFSAKLQK
jgi:iron complex outermembrane receptor protein